LTLSRPRRFISLGTKLVVLTAAVLSIASTAVFLELTVRERERLIQSKQEAAGMVADLFAVSLTAPLDFNEKDEIDATLAHLRANGDINYAAVWRPEGDAPIATFDRSKGHAEAPLSHPLASAQILNGEVVQTRSVVTPTGKQVGVVTLYFSLAAENAAFEASRVRILGWSIGMALITAVILTALARRVVISPIERLMLAAQGLEKGETHTVEASANDEVGRLANAFNQMASAITDRETRLANARASLQELVDHMRQGILVFGPGGAVEKLASRQSALIFGRKDALTQSFEGQDIGALLYPSADDSDPEALAFKEWVQGVFGLPADAWDEVADLAPKEVVITRTDGATLELALEFRPICEDDRVTRVMLLVSDETERRRLERAVEVQEAQHARQLNAMRRLMTGGAAMFATFVEATNERVARGRELLDELLKTQRLSDVDELFQTLHTLKGEARSFDLAELEAEIVRAEDAIDELRRDTRRGDSTSRERCVGAIRVCLDTMGQMVTSARETFVQASPIGGSVLDQITVPRHLLQRLEAATEGHDDEIGGLVRRLAARPFGELTSNILDGVAVWAMRERKKIALDVRGKEVPIGGPEAKVLRGAITHLLRNAVAHGIETTDARAAAGKPETGNVIVECREDEGQTKIVIEDDGAGLDFAALRARGQALGLPVGLDAAALAMAPALSTSTDVGELAGRGIGLSAVNMSLKKIGWGLEIFSEPARGTRVVLSSPRSS
jgi:signal transduction histidine kinase/HAMP domain-containing protein